MEKRHSVESMATSDVPSVDCSFLSMASASSCGSQGYEIESEVGREALKEICCSALSRVLDFPDSQLETLLGYDEENSSVDSSGVNVAKNITASLRSMKRGLSSLYRHHQSQYIVNPGSCDETGGGTTLSFGAPIMDAEQTPLLQLITHMHTFVSKEGLFRKSGNKNRMEQLIKGLEEGHFKEVIVQSKYNAHDFASVLKQYFSELPEPLLLKRHLNAYLQAIALTSPTSMLRCIQLLMLLLPPIYRVIMQHLLDLLFQVARTPKNKMDAHNLSLIFAPTLFLGSQSECLPPDTFEKLPQLLAYMIENCEEIFEVPSEVQVVAERYCKKKLRRKLKNSSSMPSIARSIDDEDLPIDLYSTSCKRQCVETFHESGQECAMEEVAKLYKIVQDMPDGPQKTHFLKRFESASKAGCTPSTIVKQKHFSISRLRRSMRRNKENATPKVTRDKIQLLKPCFKKGSLISEFNDVDENSILKSETHVNPCITPCKSTENISQQTSDFETPGSTFATPVETFKTPKTPGVYRVKFIPTMSPMVTDV